mmetsp:Transcript_23993/g.56625  ORF Transcript_23993/g.56625 Transcript_23993/m.56625 type:complete len:352 (-) Transcript_23993:135-1190(-)|eukprot:CAMPEP_0197190212 /NCGR_PEP_ID=MMETSP1423-20130617/21217_1 /TAXON_ID=476441 /ORGANISM="Pseudo-nitzschia heimii, Strain UNC1101" /LENGTH=351 /DNA_ID=CAMNT_0042642547 /DNA_START=107 /DNA_END=1162 /DNA_ORIENTATION=-
MTEPTIAADDMDAILDDALDELDDSDSDDDEAHRTNVNQSGTESKKPDVTEAAALPPSEENETKDSRRRVPMGPPRPPPDNSNGKSTANATRRSRKNDNNPPSLINEQEMEESLRRMFQDLAAAEASLTQPESARANDETRTKQEKTSATAPTRSREQEADASSRDASDDAQADEEKMMRDLFRGLMAAGGKDATPGNPPDDADEIPDLDKLFAGMEGDGAGGMDFDTDQFMDSMMEQLLSKELMYEPMKQINEKFPAWLETKKGELAPDEWDQRKRQSECFQKIVKAYESEQQASTLVELMQEVQEYGQPPLDMINEIAPGLDLDAEGLPNMDGLPPFLGGGKPEDCRIM